MSLLKVLLFLYSYKKSILEKIGVPQRPTKAEGRKQEYYLPEECLAEDFEEGEIVWAATHHAPAVIGKKLTKEYQDSKPGLITQDYEKTYGCSVFSIYIRQKPSGDLEDFYIAANIGGFYSYAAAYDLGKLKHLEEYGVDLEKL